MRKKLYSFFLFFIAILTSSVIVQAQGPTLAAGPTHTLVIHADGTLWAWGNNADGQLGDGTTTARPTPVQVGTATNWAAVFANGEVGIGRSHTVALRTDGTLWAWGNNSEGQLGDGTRLNRPRPTLIGGVSSWRRIAVGGLYTMAIRADGTLWAWGLNDVGQLGDGTTTPRLSPTQIGAATDWTAVAASPYETSIKAHTLAIRSGTLWAWGGNNYGQLGDGNRANRPVPFQVGTANNWTAVSTGNIHSAGLRTDGSLWTWGDDYNGQLGYGNNYSNYLPPLRVGAGTSWTAVSVGDLQTVAMQADGSIWAWGNNSRGQLGDSTYNQRLSGFPHYSPGRIGRRTDWRSIVTNGRHAVALRADGSVWAWGHNNFGQVGSPALAFTTVAAPHQPSAGGPWRTIAMGPGHTLAIRTDGTLWAWGDNYYGELGGGTWSSEIYPLQVGTDTNWASVATGDEFTVAIRTDGTLWAWGRNAEGRLGDGTTTDRRTPVQIGTDTNWAHISTGAHHTMAIRTDGSLWGWGNGSYGELGLNMLGYYTSPQRVGTANNWAHIAAGVGHTLAIRADGTLWAWGDNGYGEVGIGSTARQRVPVQVGTASTWASVAANEQSVAIRTDGTLWAWGFNNHGQLGDGTAINRSAPVQISTTTDWVEAKTGDAYTVARRANGRLLAWGNNSLGQLGDSTLTERRSPVVVAGGSAYTSIATGPVCAAAFRADGSLWTWGYNDFSQLGTPNFVPYPLRVNSGARVVTAAQQMASSVDKLAVFPNPVRAQAQMGGVLPTSPVLLLDLLGREVRKLPAGSQLLDAAGLPAGNYLLRQANRVVHVQIE